MPVWLVGAAAPIGQFCNVPQWRPYKGSIVLRPILALLFLALLVFHANIAAAQQQPLVMDGYRPAPRLCGEKSAPLNVETIPWIGCFYLAPGHNSTGTFIGHKVDIGVDVDGVGQFIVDGAAIEYTRKSTKTTSGTNIPYVGTVGGSGISICNDGERSSCPSLISVISSNEDKTILFSVAECLPPDFRTCVLTKANWDYKISHADELNAERKASQIAMTPIPPGPFVSWPEDIKNTAVISLMRRCNFISVMAMGNFQGPKETGTEMLQSLMLACIDHQMPDDWPNHDEVRTAIQQHFDAARQVVPNLPNPFEVMSHLPPG